MNWEELYKVNRDLRDPKLHGPCGVKVHSYTVAIVFGAFHIAALIISGALHVFDYNVTDFFRWTLILVTTGSFLYGLYHQKHEFLLPMIVLYLFFMTLLIFLSLFMTLRGILPEIFADQQRQRQYNHAKNFKADIFRQSLVLSLYCAVLFTISLALNIGLLKCYINLEDEEGIQEKSWLYRKLLVNPNGV